MDGCSVFRPWEVEKKWRTVGGWWHFDASRNVTADLSVAGLPDCIQGAVSIFLFILLSLALFYLLSIFSLFFLLLYERYHLLLDKLCLTAATAARYTITLHFTQPILSNLLPSLSLFAQSLIVEDLRACLNHISSGTNILMYIPIQPLDIGCS